MCDFKPCHGLVCFVEVSAAGLFKPLPTTIRLRAFFHQTRARPLWRLGTVGWVLARPSSPLRVWQLAANFPCWLPFWHWSCDHRVRVRAESKWWAAAVVILFPSQSRRIGFSLQELHDMSIHVHVDIGVRADLADDTVWHGSCRNRVETDFGGGGVHNFDWVFH